MSASTVYAAGLAVYDPFAFNVNIGGRNGFNVNGIAANGTFCMTASLLLAGGLFVNDPIARYVVDRRNSLGCKDVTAACAFLVHLTFCHAGSFNVDDPITLGVGVVGRGLTKPIDHLLKVIKYSRLCSRLTDVVERKKEISISILKVYADGGVIAVAPDTVGVFLKSEDVDIR
jgi:hypothetical protein